MKTHYFANIAAVQRPEAQIFVNIIAIDSEGWVQLAPFGDFGNVDGKGNRVIQRFQKPDAETIVNEFNSLLATPQRLLGLPWYIGHPDHARFKGQHTDSKAYGRVKKLEVRDDGLYANVRFGVAGKQLVEDEAFHGHSVNWRAVPTGTDQGMTVFRPVALKSVGFTNDPQIPVRPVSMSNEASDDEETTELPNEDMTIPPRLKLIAGFKADDDVTIEQIMAALEKAMPNQTKQSQSNPDNTMPNERKIKIGDKEVTFVFANDADADAGASAIETLVNDQTKTAADAKVSADLAKTNADQFANERKARVAMFADRLIAEGRLLPANKDATIETLCNAGEGFDAKWAELAAARPIVKIVPKTVGLGVRGGEILANVRERSVKLQSLIAARQAQFPNEDYNQRFAAVAASAEGADLIAQMNVAKQEAAA